MGYNTWNDFRCDGISAKHVMEVKLSLRFLFRPVLPIIIFLFFIQKKQKREKKKSSIGVNSGSGSGSGSGPRLEVSMSGSFH